MTHKGNPVAERLNVEVIAAAAKAPDFAADVLKGLSNSPKRLPFIYFYDQAGSLLFEEICKLPEYYLTRCEAEILSDRADELAAFSKGEMALVELGSGNSQKTRLLIEALLRRQQKLHYYPIDISRSMLVETSERLLAEYEGLEITALAAEYNDGIHRISETDLHQKMIVFLGSNIGNLRPERAVDFLSRIRADMGPDDCVLVGADLKKNPAVLTAAYNDSQGVTERFNKNILARINRELGGQFDLEKFRHLAFWNPAYSRMEIHLQSVGSQDVGIGSLGRSFHFAPRESIHTENSYKYSFAQLDEIFSEAGLRPDRRHRDSREYFSLNLLVPV